MLVMPLPAVARPQLTARLVGANPALAFPTMASHYYEVYYKNGLADTNWTWLTALAGDGSVKSITDAATQSQRFYRLTIH
jgi:hypothetical protein